jgi:hypothetical protein
VGIDPAGRIVVAGFAQGVAVARLNAADGSLDQSFGTGGKSTISSFGPYSFVGSVSGMAIDAAGRIAVAGNRQLQRLHRFQLWQQLCRGPFRD